MVESFHQNCKLLVSFNFCGATHLLIFFETITDSHTDLTEVSCTLCLVLRVLSSTQCCPVGGLSINHQSGQTVPNPQGSYHFCCLFLSTAITCLLSSHLHFKELCEWNRNHTVNNRLGQTFFT